MNVNIVLMIRAYGFSRKILPSSVGHFAKFRGLPQHSVCKLTELLNFSFWRDGWYSDIVL